MLTKSWQKLANHVEKRAEISIELDLDRSVPRQVPGRHGEAHVRDRDPAVHVAAELRAPEERPGSKISKTFCNCFLAGSFSAVSRRNFAIKYAFDSIFQTLQDLHPFALLQSQNFRKKSGKKLTIFVKIQQKFCKCRRICKILPKFKIFS